MSMTTALAKIQDTLDAIKDTLNSQGDNGGIGGGSTGGGRLDINATMTDSSSCTLDKTFEEIRTAYNGGMVVNVIMNGIILMPSAILEDGINFIAFVDTDQVLTAITVYVTPDNVAKYFMRTISH